MSSLLLTFRNLFLIKVPFYVLSIILLAAIGEFFFLKYYKQPVQAATVMVETKTNCYPARNTIRLNDYNFTKPILISDALCESEALEKIKMSVTDIINEQKASGNVETISFYLRKLNGGDWTTINAEEKYIPGSLMKVPILITCLKQSENDPTLLDKKILFTGRTQKMPQQFFTAGSLVTGVKYSIRELLHRMIVDSDNDAVNLISSNLDISQLKKLFADLNMPEPNFKNDYLITPTDCAKFLRILYNSSYLDHSQSEFALNLLTQSKFNLGVLKGIPNDIKVAHKFGEAGETGGDVQLSEEAIVYAESSPYLLVVMTKGKDFNKMAESISSISRVVYDKYTGKILN